MGYNKVVKMKTDLVGGEVGMGDNKVVNMKTDLVGGEVEEQLSDLVVVVGLEEVA